MSVFSIPDIHGDVGRAVESLMLANITDANGAWIAPPGTTLVQTGDLFDRGDDTQAVFKLFAALERSAAAAGSRVLRLLGNHCVMNLVGDTRYVSRADTASFGGAAARARALAADGEIGAWLLGAKVCTVVDGTLFVHAGLHPKWARLGCDGINRRAAQELARAVPRGGGEPQPAFAPMLSAADGPVWWRGLAEGDEAEACALLDESLSHIKAARMVVGHTIQERGRMRLRCGGRLVLSDVGMSRAYDSSFPFGVRDASRAAALQLGGPAGVRVLSAQRDEQPRLGGPRWRGRRLVPGGGDNVEL